MLQKVIIIKVDCQNKSGSQESGQKSQTLLWQQTISSCVISYG